MKVLNLLKGILVFFVTIAQLNAQGRQDCQFVISGKVYDQETKLPLAYVAVQVENTGIGTVTDEEGAFSIINLCEKEYELIFSRIGYKTYQHHHDFHHPTMEVFLVEDHLLLEGIVVEGKLDRMELETTNAAKLDAEALESVQTGSLGEVLSQISGVNTLSTGQNIVKPIIHGLHSNRILIINNGVRHEYQSWGSEHAPEVDPSLVDEIEVIKGAATVRYGPEALGGVILIHPPKLELSSPFSGKVRLTGKSNGQSGDGAIEIKKGFKWLSLLGGAAITRQGDLKAPNYYLTNTGKEEDSYYGALRLHPLPELDLEVYYSHFDQKLGILSGSVFGNLEDIKRAISSDEPLFTEPFSYDINQPYQDVVHDLYKATAKYVGNKHALTLRYGNQLNKRKEFGVRRGTAPNIDLELFTQTLDLDWQHPQIGNLKGKLGVQWTKQANDNLPGTNTVPFIPNYDLKRFGGYWMETFTHNHHTFELGARFDYMEAQITGREPDNTIYNNTIQYSNFTGSIGYKREFNNGQMFSTNFGTAWRPPNVAELYRFGQHSFFIEYGLWRYTIDERFDFVSTTEGILDESDRAVPPEVGYKWINAYSIQNGKFRGELTGYLNYIKHFIYSKPGGITRTPRGVFVYFIYDQTDALFWGADLTAELDHSKHWTSTWKGSYLWSKQIQNNDYFTGQPPPKLHYDLAFKPDFKFFKEMKFKVSLDYVFRQNLFPRIITVDEFLTAAQNDINRFKDDASDFDILEPPAGYLLFHIQWTAQKGPFDIQLQISNLFNQSYRNYTDRLRYFADDIGRNLLISLGYKF